MLFLLPIGITWHVTPYIFRQIFDISHIIRCHIAHGPKFTFLMYSFIFTININYGSPTILTRSGEKEEIFGMILYIHFLCFYRRKFLIHTGGEQINCTVQRTFDGYTCYSRKSYNIVLTDFEFLYLWSCV